MDDWSGHFTNDSNINAGKLATTINQISTQDKIARVRSPTQRRDHGSWPSKPHGV